LKTGITSENRGDAIGAIVPAARYGARVATAPTRRLPETLRVYGRAVRSRLLLERDFRTFKRRYESIVRPTPPTPRGAALLASLSYSTYQAKQEGVFAKALQLKGVAPVVAMLPDAEVTRRYHELFGIERFVTLEDYLTPELEEYARREAAALDESVRSTDDLKSIRYKGADVGREALSTVSRYLHEGGVDLTDPRARELLTRLLHSAVRTAVASERMLDHLEPQLILFNERNYAGEGPLCDIALLRGHDVIQFVGGFEDDTTVFKRYTEETKSIHPRSLSDASWERVRRIEWTPELDAELEREFARRYDKDATFLARWNQGWTRSVPREEIQRRLALDPERRTAVVFSHVLWDANMFFGRDLFADQEQWFVETVRAACANDRVNWIVKLHPANVWKRKRDGVVGELDEHVAIREQIGELPSHVSLLEPDTEISTWSLFDVTDYGITIRGSVGFELPCFGKTALTAGTGFYSGRGFTVDSHSAREYLGRLAAIDELPEPTREQVELAKKHAYGLFRLRQTRFTTFRSVHKPIERIDDPSEATIEIRVSSADELARAEDLRRLGEWAVDSRDLDYLELRELSA
jgi:hypothetical protein